MAARSSWKGYLKVSLLSVPVKAFTATVSDSGEIKLNQLHAGCNRRVQYKKMCPVHGELNGDQIVSGYEYGKDQYVVIDTSELDKLRTEDDKAIKVANFIGAAQLDPIYYSGKAYYLVPDGAVAQRPYAVLHQAMRDENRCAVAQVVLHSKEQLVLIRPYEELLVMVVLYFNHQITKPSAFRDEVVQTDITAEERQLAQVLIKTTTPPQFDFSQFKDTYNAKLTQLIEAKVAGQEIVAAPAHEPQHVLNLMDALKQSVAQAQAAAPKPEPAAKPPKKMAPSTSGRTTRSKKKTS